MPKLQGLIFDLEGTLLDGAVDLRQAINSLLGDYARKSLTLKEVINMSSNGAMMLVQQAFEATGGMPDKELFPYAQRFINYYHNVKPDPSQIYPHVVTTLESYFQAEVKLGLCTNKQENATYRVLEHLGLLKYFEFIAGGDTFPVHKPNPEHVYGVITALDVPRENCVFVGDGLNDIRAAQGAKIPCIIVTHGGNTDNEQTSKADRVIDSLDRLPMTLEELGFSV